MRKANGFTLVELLVSVAVLVLLVLLVSRLFSSAASVATSGNKRMDAEAQVRPLFDRMAVDFSQMVKRSDVDFFGKNTAAPNSTGGAMTGNDQIAFFSNVPGYYPPTGSQSPLSLVAYRVNSSPSSAYNKLERMGKGLLWNSVTPPASPTPTAVPMIFLPSNIAGIPAWSGAIQPSPDPNYADGNYELVGANVFRFEYYYLLKGQTDPATATTYSSILSATPWDTRISGHTSVSGMQDVAAISVCIAAIDPKSKALLSDTTTPPQIAQVASQLMDWGNTTCVGCPTQAQWQTNPGLLSAQWQSALNGIANMPRPAIQAVRIYERYFYLLPKS